MRLPFFCFPKYVVGTDTFGASLSIPLTSEFVVKYFVGIGPIVSAYGRDVARCHRAEFALALLPSCLLLLIIIFLINTSDSSLAYSTKGIMHKLT